MEQDKFTNSLINIERSISNNISAHDVLNKFVNKNHRLQYCNDQEPISQ